MLKPNTTTHLYVSIADVMSELGLCRGSVERLIREGALQAHRVGRRVLIPTDSFRAFLDHLKSAF